MKWVLSSKIHQAIVTDANLAYVGSITIDQLFMEKVDLWEGERVQVVSNTTGARLETYVIKGEAGSGTICMNGACSHLISTGEDIIIMGYTLSATPITPKIIWLKDRNRVIEML